MAVGSPPARGIRPASLSKSDSSSAKEGSSFAAPGLTHSDASAQPARQSVDGSSPPSQSPSPAEAGAAASAQERESWRSLLQAAAVAERDGDYATAASDYRQALRELPPQTSQTLLLGAELRLAKDDFLLHRYDDSLQTLTPSLEQLAGTKSGLTAQVLMVVGLDDLELNHLPQAIENLKRALALDPTSGTARLALGDTYARSSQFEDAVLEYREQLARTPAVADAWYKLGIVYLKFSQSSVQRFALRHPESPILRELVAQRRVATGHDWQGAEILLALARTLPHQAGVHAALGNALLDLGYAKEAAQEFSAELIEDPGSAPAQLGLAQTLALQNHWPSALNEFRRVLRGYPHYLQARLEQPPAKALTTAWKEKRVAMPPPLARDPAAKLWTAWLNHSSVDVDFTAPAEACKWFAENLARQPGRWLTEPCYELLRRKLATAKSLNANQLAKLAETDYRLGRYEAAWNAASALKRRQPDNGLAVYWLARSATQLASDCFEKLSVMNAGSARVHELLAQLAARHFEWTRAEKEYRAALLTAPNLPDLHFGLGTVYWQAGEWAEAQRQLEMTLALDPSSAAARYELGDAYIQERKWRAAIPCLQQAIQDGAVGYRSRLDLAEAEGQIGQPRQALSALLPVASEDQDGELHYRLALLFSKLRQDSQARQALTESERLRKATAQKAQERIQQAEAEVRQVRSLSDE